MNAIRRSRTLIKQPRNASWEDDFTGLNSLTSHFLGREWSRGGGAVLRIECCLLGVNGDSSTDVVYQR